jgi:tetratricopeptide (TPR) repeat protein
MRGWFAGEWGAVMPECGRPVAGSSWPRWPGAAPVSQVLAALTLLVVLPGAVWAVDVRVETALAEAEKLHAAGDSEGGLAVLRKVSGTIRREKGASDPDLLPILDLAGRILFEQQKLDEAEAPLSKAVALREPLLTERPGELDVEQASTLLLLGKLHASAGRLDQMVDSLVKAVVMLDSALGATHEKTLQSRGELERAVALFTQQLGPDHEATIKANEELAKVHETLGDYAAAEATLQARYDGEVQRGGPGAGPTLRAAVALARVLSLEGKEEEAIALLERAAAAGEDGSGADATATAEVLRALARVDLAIEDFAAAETALHRAHDIDARVGEATGIEAVIDDLLLARLAAVRGGFDPAADAGFQQAASRVEQLAKQDHPAAARGLRIAGDVCREADRPGMAARYYRAAIEADERLVGADEVPTAEDRLALGRCLAARGELEAAKPLLEQALKTFRRQLGPTDQATVAALVGLATVAVQAGEASAAAEAVGRVIDRRVPREGRREDEELAQLVDGAAELLAGDGREAEGEKLREDFLRLRAKQFGDGHPHVADAYVNLATARQEAGAWAAALALFRQGLERREAALGATHPDVAAALLPMARAHRALKQHAEAIDLLRRALAIWEEVAGPDHPVTVATVKQLALAQISAGNRAEAVPLMERLLAAYEADPDTPPDDTIKLLTRLAEMKHALGDTDAARRHALRAVEVDKALAAAAASAERATDLAELARVQRLLGDEEDAQTSLQAARSVAEQLPDAEARLAQIEAIYARAPAGK